MKLTKILFRNPIEKIAITTIVLYLLFILVIIVFPYIQYLNTKPVALEFDTNITHIESIEMVNWFDNYEPKKYLIYKVLQPEDYPGVLSQLSDIEYKPKYGSHSGARGNCYRIKYSNASVTFVCESGLARFNVFGHETEMSFNLRAKDKSFNNLWESILNP